MTSQQWNQLISKGVPGLTPGIREEVGGSAPVSAQVFNLVSSTQIKLLDLSLSWGSNVLEVCAVTDGPDLLWLQPTDDDKQFQSKRNSLEAALAELLREQSELSDLEEGDTWESADDELGELSIACRVIKETGKQTAAVWLGFQADSSVIVFFDPGNPKDHTYSDSENNSDFDESSYCDEFLEDLED